MVNILSFAALLSTACLIVLFSFASAGAQVEAIILANDQGVPILARNENQPLIPASTLKLLTSLAALEKLGPDYRFTTMTAYDPRSRQLFLKGFGDPLLISEELARLSNQIVITYKLESISNIVIDATFFKSGITIPGTGQSANPYDSSIGALCANFNTIYFKWSDSLSRYISAESQTPLLERFQESVRASGLKQGRILLAEDQRALYPAQLIAYFLEEQKHIPVSGQITTGPFCKTCPQTTIFTSRFTLAQVVEKLLAFSNNFIANQVMLTIGALEYGPPATLEKGIRVLKNYLRNRLQLQGISIVEGSGISRDNRISAAQMLKILIAFEPYFRLMRQNGNDFFKTGTLSNVRTRAGFLMGKDQKLYPYVIMLNQTSKGYERSLQKLSEKVARISDHHQVNR